MSDTNWDELPWMDDTAVITQYHYLWKQYGTGLHYEADAPRDALDKAVSVQHVSWREGNVFGSYPELGYRSFRTDGEIITHVVTPKIRGAWNKVSDG